MILSCDCVYHADRPQGDEQGLILGPPGHPFWPSFRIPGRPWSFDLSEGISSSRPAAVLGFETLALKLQAMKAPGADRRTLPGATTFEVSVLALRKLICGFTVGLLSVSVLPRLV